MSEQLQYVDSAESLAQLCRQLDDAPLLCFDTEFVSEDSYRPELCLVQVATDALAVIIDPLVCGSLTPFWNMLISKDRPVIVHAGREEMLFCYRSTKHPIPRLFDVQVAAGFIGCEYPASYGNLVQRFTGKMLHKEETRSDWRHRPLNHRQLEYALQDVRDLPTIYRKLLKEIIRLGRLEWLQEELQVRQNDLIVREGEQQWFRMSGVQSLRGSALAIARRLWMWRDEQATRRNVPPRRILRDDLVVELAKRGTADVKRIANLRGMNHRHTREYLPELVECIEMGVNDPVPNWTKKDRYGTRQPSSMLTQFLGAALAFICKSQNIAPAIVGTSDDLRDFALYCLEPQNPQTIPPALLRGWRSEIVGKRLEDLLHGRIGLALDDPLDEMPLRFCGADAIS